MKDPEGRQGPLQSEIGTRLTDRFGSLREEFDRLRRESDGLWAGFASRFEQSLAGLVPAGVAPSGHLSVSAARELDDASTQVDILLKLLEICLRHSSRAILLVLREGVFTVWKAAGFASDASARDASRVTLSAEGAGLLARVAEGTPCRLPAGNVVSERLLCGDAVDGILIPMTIGEKVSGALYGDAAPGEENRFDPEAIAFLSFLAGLLIERRPARKLRPSPALRAIEITPAAPRPPAAGEFETHMKSLWQEPAEPAPAARPASSPAAKTKQASPAAKPRQASPPPAEGRRLRGPLAPVDGEEKRAEARRFAELLVSEIKLYNEQAVREGREAGNLYRRLKAEIDLSRQMYEERIPENVRAGSDFLYDELVRILADGRPEALGI